MIGTPMDVTPLPEETPKTSILGWILTSRPFVWAYSHITRNELVEFNDTIIQRRWERAVGNIRYDVAKYLQPPISNRRTPEEEKQYQEDEARKQRIRDLLSITPHPPIGQMPGDKPTIREFTEADYCKSKGVLVAPHEQSSSRNADEMPPKGF